MTAEVIDATAVVVSEQSPALFGTSDPAEHIERAVAHAKALKAVVEQRGLISDIQGKKYVLYDGWALLASMVGASIVEEWTRPLADGNGWEARMLVMRNGQVIGAAENMCTRDEKRWAKADEYAIRSMAQTRAGGKAARTCLGFIVQLAGYEATPFDEMPQERRTPDTSPKPVCPEHGSDYMKRIDPRKDDTWTAFWKCHANGCALGKNKKGATGWTIFDDKWQMELQLARGEAEPVTVEQMDDLPNEE